MCIRCPGMGSGGIFNLILYGEAPPRLQPLTFLYTIYYEKGTPFVYLLLTNGTPFTKIECFLDFINDGN